MAKRRIPYPSGVYGETYRGRPTRSVLEQMKRKFGWVFGGRNYAAPWGLNPRESNGVRAVREMERYLNHVELGLPWAEC